MSTIYLCFLFKVLAKTCDNLFEKGVEKEFYQPVHKFIMNPKAITMDELYGGINKLTLEWRDGLMGLTVRHCVQVGVVDWPDLPLCQMVHSNVYF